MSPVNPVKSEKRVEQPVVRESLIRLVQKVTGDLALQEDLMQEALLHLWLIETRRPGQTASWYLQSCKFHLQHYLASGKSVDSGKRREGRLPFAFDSENGEGIPEQSDSGNSVLTNVSAREILVLLSRQLKPQERAVLDCLADGLGAREIGRELKISHTMVIRYRRKIASLLKKLEGPEAAKGSSVNHRRNDARVANISVVHVHLTTQNSVSPSAKRSIGSGLKQANGHTQTGNASKRAHSRH